MKKIMEIPGGRGSNAKPSGTENPVGWGVKLEKTLRGGGVWIFSGTTQSSFKIETTNRRSGVIHIMHGTRFFIESCFPRLPQELNDPNCVRDWIFITCTRRLQIRSNFCVPH